MGRDGGRPVPARGTGATRAGVPTNTVSVDETPKVYGQLRAVQGAPQRRTLAELRIAEHRRHGDPAGADLPQQRERQLPLRLPADPRRNAGARALRGRQPRLGQVQGRAHHPRLGPRPQGDRHGGLAVGDLAERPAVLPRDPDRVRPLLGKARAIENEDARAIGDRAAQVSPDPLGRPGRIGDEMLEGLIGTGSRTRSSIALIDLRRLSLSSPSRYRRNAPRCATCVKHTSNGSSQSLKRSSHAGALRGSRDNTETQRTERVKKVQAQNGSIAQILERIY